MRLGRYSDAANALRRVIQLEKPDPNVLSSYGEALVMANQGAVDEDAVKVFRAALQLNPRQATPQYYLGLAELQAGRKDAAIAYWIKMLKNASRNAPWRAQIEAQIKKAGGTVPESAIGIPDPADGVPDIGEMVSNLAARLEKDGNDLAGWLMLARSYMVQKRPGEAAKALEKASTFFKGKPEAQEKIAAMRKSLGM
jgi:cytochrome c-type biogenesis protein CcmH